MRSGLGGADAWLSKVIPSPTDSFLLRLRPQLFKFPLHRYGCTFEMGGGHSCPDDCTEEPCPQLEAELKKRFGGVNVDNSTHDRSSGFHLLELHNQGTGQALIACMCCTMIGLASSMVLGFWRLQVVNRRARDRRGDRQRGRYDSLPRAEAQPVTAQPTPAPAPAPAAVPALPQFVSQPLHACLLYTSPSPRDGLLSRMPSSA